MFTPTTILTETIEAVPQRHAWGQKAPEQLPSHKTGEQLIKWLLYLHLPPFYLQTLAPAPCTFTDSTPTHIHNDDTHTAPLFIIYPDCLVTKEFND